MLRSHYSIGDALKLSLRDYRVKKTIRTGRSVTELDALRQASDGRK